MKALFFAVFLIGCGNSDPAGQDAGSGADGGAPVTVESAVGTWTLTGMTCNGVVEALQNYVITDTFTDTTLTSDVKSSGCEGTLSGAQYKISNGTVTVIPGTGTITCSGADGGAPSCVGSYNVVAGANKVTAAFKCPDDLNSTSNAQTTISGGTATIAVSSCSLSFTKH